MKQYAQIFGNTYHLGMHMMWLSRDIFSMTAEQIRHIWSCIREMASDDNLYTSNIIINN